MSDNYQLASEKEKELVRKRTYTKVTDEQRAQLIELLDKNMSIKDASDQMNINYENAKAIYRVYRLEKRKTKQQKRPSRFTYDAGMHFVGMQNKLMMQQMATRASQQFMVNEQTNRQQNSNVDYQSLAHQVLMRNNTILLSFDRQCEMQKRVTQYARLMRKRSNLKLQIKSKQLSKLAKSRALLSETQQTLGSDKACKDQELQLSGLHVTDLSQNIQISQEKEDELRGLQSCFFMESQQGFPEIAVKPVNVKPFVEQLNMDVDLQLPLKRSRSLLQDRELSDPYIEELSYLKRAHLNEGDSQLSEFLIDNGIQTSGLYDYSYKVQTQIDKTPQKPQFIMKQRKSSLLGADASEHMNMMSSTRCMVENSVSKIITNQPARAVKSSYFATGCNRIDSSDSVVSLQSMNKQPDLQYHLAQKMLKVNASYTGLLRNPQLYKEIRMGPVENAGLPCQNFESKIEQESNADSKLACHQISTHSIYTERKVTSHDQEEKKEEIKVGDAKNILHPSQVDFKQISGYKVRKLFDPRPLEQGEHPNRW